MKNYFLLLIICCAYLLFSCNRKRECVDNISAYLTKIPYTNNELVTFINDTLGERKDTFYIKLNNVYNNYYDNGDEYNEACWASIKILYSNTYRYQIYQFNNAQANHIEVYTSLFVESQNIDTFYVYNKGSIPAIIYSIDRKFIDSIYYNNWNDIFKTPDGSVLYNDFMVVDSPYYKLVEYTTLDNQGNKRKWRLQE